MKHKNEIFLTDISSYYFDVYRQGNKFPERLNVGNFLTLVSVNDTLKVSIPDISIEQFSHDNIINYQQNNNYLDDTRLHLMVDENYLYILTKRGWKRIAMAEFLDDSSDSLK